MLKNVFLCDFQSTYGKNEEFFLFASIMDATMIDKRLGDKPLFFELSIGNAGNSLDGHNFSSVEQEMEEDDNLGACFPQLASACYEINRATRRIQSLLTLFRR
jgi:hypothetical protein